MSQKLTNRELLKQFEECVVANYTNKNETTEANLRESRSGLLKELNRVSDLQHALSMQETYCNSVTTELGETREKYTQLEESIARLILRTETGVVQHGSM